MWTEVIVFSLLAYVLGCLQTGYYLVRARTGQDLRKLGSGGTGARNAGRVLGRSGFILTLAGDVAKGVLAIAIPIWLHASPAGAAAALVAVTVGHVWPAQLRFSGGRGIAVGLGALALYEPRLLAVLGVSALAGFVIFRRFQAGGILGFAVLPLFAWWIERSPTMTIAVGLQAALVLYAHRTHIARWLRPEHNAGKGTGP